MKIVLPPPLPEMLVPAWTPRHREAWARNVDRATTLQRGPGVGRNFEALMAEVRRFLQAGDTRTVAEQTQERRFARALVLVWNDDVSLARRTLTRTVVDQLAETNLSRLTTLGLASLYLEHFDELDGWRDGLFEAVRLLLRRSLGEQIARSGDAVAALTKNDDVLLHVDGPRVLARRLVAQDGDLTEWFRRESLSAYADTRYARKARDEFYLAQIDAADAERGDHAFLNVITDEVLARKRTEATERDGTYFGHDVLTALTAKTTRRPSEVWLEAMLGLAGDPRTEQTEQWRTWWSRVPQENRVRAVRWMSGVNLTAFLNGVEMYARHIKNDDMLRMMERRKVLLQGLYEQDRVLDVRLILGSDIRRWITKSVKLDLHDVAALLDPGKDDTAVIYVDCGDFSLVEGSHNFKLHVFVGGHLDRLANRSVRVFHGSHLRDEIPGRQVLDHGVGSYRAFKHFHHGAWIRNTLDFLRERGIVVDEYGLMTPVDFADMSRRRAERR